MSHLIDVPNDNTDFVVFNFTDTFRNIVNNYIDFPSDQNSKDEMRRVLFPVMLQVEHILSEMNTKMYFSMNSFTEYLSTKTQKKHISGKIYTIYSCTLQTNKNITIKVISYSYDFKHFTKVDFISNESPGTVLFTIKINDSDLYVRYFIVEDRSIKQFDNVYFNHIKNMPEYVCPNIYEDYTLYCNLPSINFLSYC